MVVKVAVPAVVTDAGAVVRTVTAPAADAGVEVAAGARTSPARAIDRWA